MTVARHPRSSRGFTLIELMVVFALIAGLLALVGRGTGTFAYWREESFVRALRERLEFLHHRSIADQLYYQMELSLPENSYRIGVLRSDHDVNSNVSVQSDSGVGSISLELAVFLNPSLGNAQTMIPPPSFPSLAQAVHLPSGCRIHSIRTRTTVHKADDAHSVYLVFNPQGFSEFAVIQLDLTSGPVTILSNPFTGSTQVFRGYKDFQWTFGPKP